MNIDPNLLPMAPKMGAKVVPPPVKIPVIQLNHGGKKMPMMAVGTASDPPVAAKVTKTAVIQAIELGYRHIDTAYKYKTEQPIGEALQEALRLGLAKSRDDLFITSKLWCGDAHPQLVVHALHKSLRNLKLDYLDQFLIHWPVSSTAGKDDFPIKKEDLLPMDYHGVWSAMEECQRLGLTKSIGLSNFSTKKLANILAKATIPPAVNQVEVNPFWQQKKLIDFCKQNGIMVTAYSPLGAIGTFYGSNRVMECHVLKEIATSKGKTIPQVCLRWAYEQGIAMAVKSFKRERMMENLMIFDWELSQEDHQNIRGIPQSRGVTGSPYYISTTGPIKSVHQLWDGDT